MAKQEGAPVAIDLEKLRLRDVQFVECSITNRESEQPMLRDELHDCDFSYAIGHFLDVERHMVGIELRLNLDGIDEERNPVGVRGHFWLRFLFEVLNMEELLPAGSTDDADLPPALYLMLLSIAYSTARGLVIAKTASTVLQGVTLPIVDVRQLAEGTARAGHANS
jgi:hypothetical protein